MHTKYIFVLGGVLSGLGKGIVTSSIGKLLQSKGYTATSVKIDPYINLDAGTMRPTEHGEVWVTEDGGEIDQDLGNYERFLGKNIPKRHNITTGQVFLSVIEKERKLEYGGRDVEMFPDIINEIKSRITSVADDNDFVLVEVGGTSGDLENQPFLHACREIGREHPSVYILVTYVPFLRNVGELKTKPTQHAAMNLRQVGIFPDFIVTRGERKVDEPRKATIGKRCFIDSENVIDDPDLESIYQVPMFFEQQKFGEKILKKFGISAKEGAPGMANWEERVNKLMHSDKVVRIGVVGKYVKHGDSEHKDVYLSVLEALKHACAEIGVKPNIEQIQSTLIEEQGTSALEKYDGIVVPGGFGATGTEGIITTIKYCRENNVPFLGLCYGLQMAVIEFARNVCGMDDANTTEINCDTHYPVIDFMPEQKDLIKLKQYGATMRLGAYPAVLKEGSKVREIYGQEFISERHRHRYEVNPEFIEQLEEKGLVFSGRSPDRRLMEFLELPNHPFFIATQSHPEFKSRFETPSPLFKGFVNAAIGKTVQKTL
ncbi:MAG: CTP synthase [Candidatus Nanoarchaeia archaeon]|nr:CTP synthase [Candidatus Nanoarchaeia archaeon]